MPVLTIPSPLGPISVHSDGDGVTAITFADTLTQDDSPDAACAAAAAWLRDYFSGRHRPPDFPVAAHGTPVQNRVWALLNEIPPGETRSYGELAAALGQPGAARAVGLANGRNPLAIAVPCHRVIGSSGQLTGYAGGMERKRWLLVHERPARQASLFGGAGDPDAR